MKTKPRSRANPRADTGPGAHEADASLFSALNRLVEPGVRAGLGSLWMLPVGLIVLETTGRKSGLPQRVPLLAAMMGGHVVVSTVRVEQSQWLRNVMANPGVRYWLRGQELSGQAVVVMTGRDVPEAVDDDARCVVEALRPAAALGAAFVILLHVRQ